MYVITFGGRFKNAYELLNLRALEISMLFKDHIFQCMGKIFCVEFQRVSLKFHTKYLTQTLKDVDFIHRGKFNLDLRAHKCFWNAPLDTVIQHATRHVFVCVKHSAACLHRGRCWWWELCSRSHKTIPELQTWTWLDKYRSLPLDRNTPYAQVDHCWCLVTNAFPNNNGLA